MKVSFVNHEKFECPVMVIETTIAGSAYLYDIQHREKLHMDAACQLMQLAASAMHDINFTCDHKSFDHSTKIYSLDGNITVITKICMRNNYLYDDECYMRYLKRFATVINL